MDTSLNKIKQLVKQKIGLDSSTIGDNTLEKIINRRMMKKNISEYNNYYSLLNNEAEELNELLEIAVIPETWFFRDIRPFEAIYKSIKEGLNKNHKKEYRILSIPCSTGEEPYSLSMYLINKGIIDSTFSIDAVDVSQRALQLAEQGIYSNNSFRGKHYNPYQKIYFKHNFENNNDNYSIHKRISDRVNFSILNILHGNVNLHNRFDFVLCRNLLIYFDEQTKLTAFKQLEKCMKSDGVLYIGHSEFGAIPSHLFKSTGSDNAFGLIKHSQSKTDITKPALSLNTKPIKTVHKKHPKPINIKESVPASLCISLKQIRTLADTKELSKAEHLCRKYIEVNSDDDEALCLLGIISSSLKKDDVAESFFRKALFLNPKHYDSLLHLSLILENKGDLKNSNLLKKRAKKTKQP